jgi:hypothetical protein
MLACLQGLDRPLIVQPVGEGDVDAVDLGVVEDGLVAVLDLVDAVLGCVGCGLGAIARCNSLDDDLGVRLCRGDECIRPRGVLAGERRAQFI